MNERALTPRVRRAATPLVYLATGFVLMWVWIPLAFWIHCAVSATRAWLDLGYWPSYNHPDPKTIPHVLGSESDGVLFGVAALVALSLLAFQRLPKRWWLWSASLLWPLAWAGCLALGVLDPGGILEWYFD